MRPITEHCRRRRTCRWPRPARRRSSAATKGGRRRARDVRLMTKGGDTLHPSRRNGRTRFTSCRYHRRAECEPQRRRRLLLMPLPRDIITLHTRPQMLAILCCTNSQRRPEVSIPFLLDIMCHDKKLNCRWETARKHRQRCSQFAVKAISKSCLLSYI